MSYLSSRGLEGMNDSDVNIGQRKSRSGDRPTSDSR